MSLFWKNKYRKKVALFLLSLCASAIAIPDEWSETWLGHAGDWSFVHASHPQYTGLCVGKRRSDDVAYHLSIGEYAGIWTLWVRNITTLSITQARRYQIVLQLDTGTEYPLEATADQDSSLIIADLPPEFIEELKHADELSLRVDDHVLDAFSLRRIRSLIEELHECHRDKIRPIAQKSPLDFGQPPEVRHLNAKVSRLIDSGHYSDALSLAEDALTLSEEKLGADHPGMLQSLDNLARIHGVSYRFQDAETLYIKALRLIERSIGVDDISVAGVLNNLGVLYTRQQRYSEASSFLERSLRIRETLLDPNDPAIGVGLNNLAALYKDQGDYAAAEKLYKKALVIRQRALGLEHIDTALSLNNLADLYSSQGQDHAAEKLYRQVLAIRQKLLDPGHPEIATSLNNLAAVSQDVGRYDEAEKLYKQSLKLTKSVYGGEHPDYARVLSNLASLYQDKNRLKDSESLQLSALQIQEATLPNGHVDIALSMNNLAGLYASQGRFKEAEALFERSSRIELKVRGEAHPRLASSLSSLAAFYYNSGETEKSHKLYRKVLAINSERLTLGLVSSQSLPTPAMRMQSLDYLGFLVRQDQLTEQDFKDAMIAMQISRRSETERAFRQLAERLAATSKTDLAAMVRTRQNVREEIIKLELQLLDAYGLEAVSDRETAFERLTGEIERLQQQETRLQETLVQRFPDYAEFEGSRLAELDELEQVLLPGEAALAWVLGERESYLLIVRADRGARLRPLSLSQAEIAKRVERLHQALDLAHPSHEGEFVPFPAAGAFELFKRLFGANWRFDLEGIERLVLVPEGPLTRLAFPALLTAAPDRAEFSPSSLSYRDAQWLARHFAVSVVPSLSTLTILRGDLPDRQSTEPFLGVGDPLLDDHPAKTRGAQGSAAGQSFSVRAVPSTKQTQAVDVSPESLRKLRLERIRQQPSLTDTADELRRIAKLLGAKEDSLLLREAATEQRVKQSPLERYRILSFATHGVLAGELGKGIEPGLILTPPAEATEVDDGFLSLSEVAELELSADWVVLSACNTAAPASESDSGPDASSAAGGVSEGLTGLAKAFTYAGAKALLVSHWAVASGPNVELMETIFRGYRDQKLSRAEAHRHAMLAMLEAEDPLYHHPSIWAPFVLVGDGG